MISSGSPHVRPMWAVNTCGEPNEIELTIRVLTDCFTGLFQAADDDDDVDGGLAVFGFGFGFGGANVNEGDLPVLDTDPDMYDGFGDADLAVGGHDAAEGITF